HAFQAEMLATFRRVEGHYARLFEEAPSLAGPGGNLVFTGTDDDPGTLETLRGLGFRDVSAAAGVVRRWHHGRYRSTTSPRARELLTELMPAIMGSAPGLAAQLARRTVLLDSVLSSDFYAALPSAEEMTDELSRLL